WGAVALGLAGVLVIVRPGTGDFSALSILAVLGMIGFAGRDLASRAAPRSLAVPVLGFWGFVAVLAAGALVWAWEGTPPVHPGGAAAACLMGAALIGAFAYSALMRAMRTGDVSAVTPFRYLRLPFGAGLGIALFGESPGWPMLVGSALIVLSGLIIIRRGGTRAAARQGGRA
ncbi:DMT family transporter, partial [Wenxinia saemankumensis]